VADSVRASQLRSSSVSSILSRPLRPSVLPSPVAPSLSLSHLSAPLSPAIPAPASPAARAEADRVLLSTAALGWPAVKPPAWPRRWARRPGAPQSPAGPRGWIRERGRGSARGGRIQGRGRRAARGTAPPSLPPSRRGAGGSGRAVEARLGEAGSKGDARAGGGEARAAGVVERARAAGASGLRAAAARPHSLKRPGRGGADQSSSHDGGRAADAAGIPS